uniref:Serpentine receptor class gamma n=1 Tax=Parastrongyloides trichosuri TaxID=131310 RepID=A0A0N5A5N8_PARTI
MLLNDFRGIFLTVYLSILFIIDVISLLIYILLLYFIIKRLIKNDGTVGREFYTIFVFNGILDIIFLIEEYISFKPAQLGLFKTFYVEIFPNTIFAGACYTYSLCQYMFIALSSLTVTFNRYYCIKYPLNYKFLWRSWKLFILATWPLIFAIPMFIVYHNAKVDYVEDESGRLSVVFLDANVNNILWYTTIYIHLAVLVLNFVLNVLLIKQCRQEVGKNAKRGKNFKLDITMAKFALVYYIIFVIVFGTEVVMTLALNSELYSLANDFLSTIPLCQSLLVFSPPYTLLILSDDLRKQFLSSLKCINLNTYKNKNSDKSVAIKSRSIDKKVKKTSIFM